MTLQLSTITFDCTDVEAVAAFWSAALDRKVDDGASADFASITTTPALAFQRVPEGKTVKNRVHLDLEADNRAKEVKRLLALGASRVGDHDGWTTLRDVEGNELCIA